MARVSRHGRDANLDLIKWLAMLTMLLDHLRNLWPEIEWLFIAGRLAFPLFCLGIAANVARSQSGALYTDENVRYLGWMVAFALISELPYRLLSSDSSTALAAAGPAYRLGRTPSWPRWPYSGSGRSEPGSADSRTPDVRDFRCAVAGSIVAGHATPWSGLAIASRTLRTGQQP